MHVSDIEIGEVKVHGGNGRQTGYLLVGPETSSCMPCQQWQRAKQLHGWSVHLLQARRATSAQHQPRVQRMQTCSALMLPSWRMRGQHRPARNPLEQCSASLTTTTPPLLPSPPPGPPTTIPETPQEGHLPLLQGGRLLASWFRDAPSPHQLDHHHLTRLLTDLLLHGSTTAPATETTATAATTSCCMAAEQQAQAQTGGLPNSGNERRAAAAAAATASSARNAAELEAQVHVWAKQLLEAVQAPASATAAAAPAPGSSGGTVVEGPGAADAGAGAEASASEAVAALQHLASSLLDSNGAPGSLLAGPAAVPLPQPQPQPQPAAPQLNAPARPPSRVITPASDPLVSSYRPLVFYMAMEGVAAVSHVALRSAGPGPQASGRHVLGWRAQPQSSCAWHGPGSADGSSSACVSLTSG